MTVTPPLTRREAAAFWTASSKLCRTPGSTGPRAGSAATASPAAKCRATNVLLPEPVGPTMTTSANSGTRRLLTAGSGRRAWDADPSQLPDRGSRAPRTPLAENLSFADRDSLSGLAVEQLDDCRQIRAKVVTHETEAVW